MIKVVATYELNGLIVDVVDQTGFYDIFDQKSGECLNEGSIFEELPSDKEVRDFLAGEEYDGCDDEEGMSWMEENWDYYEEP